MKWFKHDTDASTDAKVKKLIMRHGAIGYAVYFHCLELIMSEVSESHITFELEHDAEIIADNLKIQGDGMNSGVDIVNKIMCTILELRLFQSSQDRIFCMKLLTRLDSSMTSNKKFRERISTAKVENKALLANSHAPVMTPSSLNHDTIMQEETRREENRRESNTPYNPPNNSQPFQSYRSQDNDN